MWGPVDDLKHMGECLRQYGKVKRNGVTIDEQYCLDRRPSVLLCEPDSAAKGTSDDDTTIICTTPGLCPDDINTDDDSANGGGR